jgi:hypothetical protein
MNGFSLTVKPATVSGRERQRKQAAGLHPHTRLRLTAQSAGNDAGHVTSSPRSRAVAVPHQHASITATTALFRHWLTSSGNPRKPKTKAVTQHASSQPSSLVGL